MSDAALRELMTRPWHGNVRELRNVVESASVVCRGDTILPQHLSDPTSLLTTASVETSLDPVTQLNSAIHAWTTAQLSNPSATVDDLYNRFLKATEPTIHRETLRDKLKRVEETPK
jgi:two-component system nitrogen regulation response regulator GlnG